MKVTRSRLIFFSSLWKPDIEQVMIIMAKQKSIWTVGVRAYGHNAVTLCFHFFHLNGVDVVNSLKVCL